MHSHGELERCWLADKIIARRSAIENGGLAGADHDEQMIYVQARVSEAWFTSSLRFSAYENHMERRAAQRRPVRKAGMIEFPGGAFSCMVRDLSEAGAALDVPSSSGIPDHFTLLVSGRSDIVRCRSVWRTERQIGVAFETDQRTVRSGPPEEPGICNSTRVSI